jgi:NAD(P)-dependent dehydrogenase (short-subunit alcohol dehydrogenase family)
MNTTAWKGKVAIVTGGGSGIGKELAMQMAGAGAKVMVTDINGASAKQVAEGCGRDARWHALDVADRDAVRTLVQDVHREHGRLDYMFNNAGIAVAGEVHEIPLADWDRIMRINIGGVLNGVLAAYPLMVAQGSGHIVNTASLAGLGPAPLLGPYGMSKHAVVGLSNSLRIEAMHHGVKVSVLCPAAIETPLLDEQVDTHWFPDMRRFLTNLAGPPYPLDRFGERALRSIERNEGVIVIPGRAKAAWVIGRLFPGLVTKLSADAVALERKDRK